MIWHSVFLLSLCIVCIEIYQRLQLTRSLDDILRVLKKSKAVLSSPAISDHWKELVVNKYAKIVFGATTRLATLLCFVLLFLYIGEMLKPGISDSVFSVLGLLQSLFFCSAYIFLKRRIK